MANENKNNMNGEQKGFLTAWIAFIIGVIILVSVISFAVYINHKMRVETFKETINDLTDEQKCLHICGYEFGNVFENYKFCVEKCDRISERKSQEIKNERT